MSYNKALLRAMPEYRRAKHEAQESTRALERIVARLEIEINRSRPDLVEIAHEAAEALRGHQPGLSMRMRETAISLHQRINDRPRVVCICGSTRFAERMNEVAITETLAGRIVVRPEVVAYDGNKDPQKINPEQKAALDELHKRKIDVADEILVVNVGGYVGPSTRGEIEYARKQGKPVRWLEPDKAI